MLTTDVIAHFPAAPGVYLMKDNTGTVLYVGKACNLRKRVRAYFGKEQDARYQIRFLMGKVTSIDFIVTDTEKEALILENSLIKEHRPRYNLDLRDDKTYFSLRLDPREEFPRLTIIRKVPHDGARYFGPYSSAAAAREVLKQIYKLFPLRHYPLATCRQRKRPCLYYQLRQCSAPCHGRINADEYAGLVEGASFFLAGQGREIVRLFKERMATAAARQLYEEAARYRDLLRAIEVTVERQKVVTNGGDSDVLGLHREGDHLYLSILFFRHGTLLDRRTFDFTWELDNEEAISSFLNEYYNRDVVIPDEILLPLATDVSEALADLLSERRGKKVTVLTPRRGTKVELVRMAGKNAESAALQRQKSRETAAAILRELLERLHLRRIPRRIECYDISNFQGQTAVGSRVSFLDGQPDKDHYRRYRIKTVDRADDFGMMREVLFRRFRQEITDDPFPDLIVVDGGIGQLNVLSAVLEDLGIAEIDLAGLAKSRVERDMVATEVERSDERVFLPGRKNPVVLRQNAPALLLLARIRDEAHRFAITYHQKLRGKKALTSALDAIAGVGPARRKELLKTFGSLEALLRATVEEIAAVKGIGQGLAAEILAAFAARNEE
ncbi:excinuclease ABC subunit UvrC [Geobacter argillaceus]|uniref:UvrABC system protein C n=1 Tax=Geobacter argillaceus TaxID=345631 RepID=A0A562VMC9_9BACT|nr:excinuclease ABC subunit C [Geobacter argillaceus]